MWGAPDRSSEGATWLAATTLRCVTNNVLPGFWLTLLNCSVVFGYFRLISVSDCLKIFCRHVSIGLCWIFCMSYVFECILWLCSESSKHKRDNWVSYLCWSFIISQPFSGGFRPGTSTRCSAHYDRESHWQKYVIAEATASFLYITNSRTLCYKKLSFCPWHNWYKIRENENKSEKVIFQLKPII